MALEHRQPYVASQFLSSCQVPVYGTPDDVLNWPRKLVHLALGVAPHTAEDPYRFVGQILFSGDPWLAVVVSILSRQHIPSLAVEVGRVCSGAARTLRHPSGGAGYDRSQAHEEFPW